MTTETGTTTRVVEIATVVTSALVGGWDAIRARHPDVPEAVVSMATGGRESSRVLAHFWADRWRARDGDGVHHEVFVSAESLQDGAEEVFHSLLHEAAHALCQARGLPDGGTSGYHNKSYCDAAAELGMGQRADPSPAHRKKKGFAATVVTAQTLAIYATQIAALDAAISATRVRPPGTWRRSGPTTVSTTGATGETEDEGLEESVRPAPKENRNYLRALCRCEPRLSIRAAPTTLARRVVKCGLCDAVFEADES